MKIKKPYNILELGMTDTSDIKQLAKGFSEEVWNLENSKKENDFEVFHHTKHIVFKFIKRNQDHRQYYSNPIWDVCKNRLLPVMESVISKYEFKNPVFPKVMLARLAANAVIDRHRDGAGSNLHTHKIHIPLQTNEKARFFVRDESFHLKEGVAYEVNNIVPHAVDNSGDQDRIHFIFEVFDEEAQI